MSVQVAEPKAAAPAESRLQTLVLALVLIAVTALTYSPVHGYEFFSLDDHFYILNNAHIQHGLDWTTVHWALTSFDHANWIPLSFLSHALDYSLFGRNPAGYHDINVLFHALNAALLFWVLKRATGSVWRSYIVGLLFALHPLNVEGVAWIAERKTVLSMFFFLLALAAYRWYAENCSLARFALVAASFAAGLAAKSQVITLPCVLLLFDFWPLRRLFPTKSEPSPYRSVSALQLVLEKLPLFALCLLDAYFTLLSEGVARPRFWPPFSQRLANAIYSYARYVRLVFWPTGLAPMYPNPGDSLRAWQIALSLAVLVAISLLVFRTWRLRYPVVGWLWFLGTLAPMVQIIQFGKEGMADRFAYQALIGLFIMIAWGAADWSDQLQLSYVARAGVTGVILIALTLATHRQITYWKTSKTMWLHALDAIPNHWMAYDQIGLELAQESRWEEAIPYFLKAVSIDPNDSLANLQIANYDHLHGNPGDAINRALQALRDPALPADQLRGIFQNLSYDYRKIGDIPKAVEYAAKAASLPRN
jgi:protein O-mannosyl-transferase